MWYSTHINPVNVAVVGCVSREVEWDAEGVL